MTLLDRYVAEVARRLPRSQRADISRELRSSLVDALESRFGPTASEEDEVVVLRELGPPENVASSYRPSSAYLIGPEWFQPFSVVVRIHLMAVAGVLVAGSALLVFFPAISSNVGRDLSALVAGVAHVGLFSFGTVVLVFHLLERGEVRSRWPRKEWNPRDLPVTIERDRVGRGETLTALVVTAVFLVLLHQFKSRIGLPSVGLKALLSDVVRENMVWLSAAMVMSMAQYALLLWQARWHWYTRSSKLAVDIFGVYVIYRMCTAVVVGQATLTQAGLPADVVTAIVQIASGAPLVVGAFVVFDTLRMFFRAGKDHESALSSGHELAARQGHR